MTKNEQALADVADIVGAVLRLPQGTVDPDLDLVAAGLDSLRMVEVLVALEQHFDIQIPERLLEASAFGSVRTIAALVEAAGRA